MEGWGAFEGAGPDAPLTGSGWFLTPLVSVKREESVQGGRMGLAASPWSMKGSYSKATRVRSTLAWPPSGEAVDDAQLGGERSLTTRLDGRAGGLTLTHLRGSSDYRSCQHLAQRSVLTQLNGSPKTSVNTAVNTVLTHPPGKTRVYLQKTGYTREIPGSASMPRAPYSQGPCANCGSHRLLKYAHRTMCVRYRCQKAASALRQARLAGGGADDAVVPTFCFKIDAVLGMRFCEPEQLIAKKRRNRLAAADKAVCYLTRGTFKEDSNDARFTDNALGGARGAVRELWQDAGPLKNGHVRNRSCGCEVNMTTCPPVF